MSTPLELGSAIIHCAVCIQAGRATKATHQTRDLLCGCDQHIQELEQHGLAAVRRARRRAVSGPYGGPSINAAPAGRALPESPDFSAQQNTVLLAVLRPVFDLELILIQLLILGSKPLPDSWRKLLHFWVRLGQTVLLKPDEARELVDALLLAAEADDGQGRRIDPAGTKGPQNPT